MGDLSASRGIDFLQARTQVIKSIRLAINKHQDANSRSCDVASRFHFFYNQCCYLTNLAIPAVCCTLLIVSLSSQTSTQFISGLLVSLFVVVAVVVLNMHLHKLLTTAESSEIRRELEKILFDYENFLSSCIDTNNGGNGK